jgi:multiple sugar transport system permease protein
MWSLIIVDVWQWTPFLTMIFLASLMTLPQETLEAADVDGASPPQKFLHIMFPLMRTIVVIALVLRGIDLFKTFDIIYSLTGGGPGRLTETLNIYTYNMLFTNLEVGYAAALSIVAVIIASITLTQLGRSTALGGPQRRSGVRIVSGRRAKGRGETQ